jgi:hypothetical protein
MRKRFFYLLIFLPGSVVLSNAVAQQAPQLQFSEETYNFGTIGELKGPATH